MSDRDREKVDADAKQMLRKLNASIKSLRESEEVRHETETALINQKYGGGKSFSMAKRWVAGGLSSSNAGSGKSNEQVAAEDQEKAVSTHRGSVLWMLGQRLQECISTQQTMMEIRISREMEKNRSVLAKARAPDMAALRAMMEPGDDTTYGSKNPSSAGTGRRADEEAQRATAAYSPATDLTPEQIQMFQQDNADMLRHYESTLDQVRYVFKASVEWLYARALTQLISKPRTAQKSLVEISELQTQLVDNLTAQSANIDLLMTESSNTTENVGGGNKQLKQATQRPSTAKYTFYATCGLCTFLLVWDLII